jgi:hypothetical protein
MEIITLFGGRMKKERQCIAVNGTVLTRIKKLALKLYGGERYLSRYAEDLFKKEIKSQDKKGNL